MPDQEDERERLDIKEVERLAKMSQEEWAKTTAK